MSNLLQIYLMTIELGILCDDTKTCVVRQVKEDVAEFDKKTGCAPARDTQPKLQTRD
jgi:hypothetical protein